MICGKQEKVVVRSTETEMPSFIQCQLGHPFPQTGPTAAAGEFSFALRFIILWMVLDDFRAASLFGDMLVQGCSEADSSCLLGHQTGQGPMKDGAIVGNQISTS